jgi:bifunctional DNA-binding transcriptional regulator/antitoxin component of YhaV-PrlF toxin-antitoxin module
MSLYPFEIIEKDYIDEQGNINIPLDLRKKIDLEIGDEVTIYLNDTSIIHIEKTKPSCISCYISDKKLAEFFKGHHICKDCIENFIKSKLS